MKVLGVRTERKVLRKVVEEKVRIWTQPGYVALQTDMSKIFSSIQVSETNGW